MAQSIPFREKLLKTPLAESYKKGWEKALKTFITFSKPEKKNRRLTFVYKE